MNIPITRLARAGSRLVNLTAALGLLVLGTANASAGGDTKPGIAPPNSHAYGKTLTEWLSTYWRWYYTGADPAQGKIGPVELMPLPAADYISGDGTPASPALYRGQLEVTLAPGTPFVLPEFAWVWERYNNGTPDDIPMDDAVALAGAHPVLTIDGKTVLSDQNKAAFYVPVTPFDPIVSYPTPSSYGSIAALSFQGIGVVGLPLSEGVHVIHLYEPLIIPVGGYPVFPAGYGVIYDNTWIVTVAQPPRIIPPDKSYRGKSYSEWSAEHWKWIYGLQVSQHPLFMDGDVDLSLNQPDGPVWFLGGTFTTTPAPSGGVVGTANRIGTVPAGKALFFPLIDAEWDNAAVPPNPPTTFTSDELRGFAKALMDSATGITCKIDGMDVGGLADVLTTPYRATSPVFDYTLSATDNVDQYFGYDITGLVPGAVADGVYLMLAPLSPGEHNIHFTGELPGFALDITYHLIVAPDSRN